jgi:hypothetical protein
MNPKQCWGKTLLYALLRYLAFGNLWFVLWPAVVPNVRVVRIELANQLSFFLVDLISTVGKEDYFAVNSHIHPFFKTKILSDHIAFSTTPVVDTVREIFPDVDFTVWVCDFVDNLAITIHIDLQRN